MAQVRATRLRRGPASGCRRRRCLIAAGDAVNEPDAEPWATPLAWAAKMGHEELAKFLRERGAVG